MKKFFTLFFALAAVTAAQADDVKILSLGMGIPGIDEPQLMGLGMSSNGRFVCGSIEMGEGFFISDLTDDNVIFQPTEDPEGAELRHVDNNGLAIGYNGPGVTYSINGIETVLQTPEGNYKYVLGEDLTDDGKILIGSLVANGYLTFAAYSKEGGEWTILPMPDDELLGDYAGEGSSAKYISGDGKIILGCIGSFGPAIMWVMNDEGEYSPVILTGENATPDVEIYGIFACGLSNNGKYVLGRASIADEENGSVTVPVVYNTETNETTVYNESQDIDQYIMGLFPTAIADDGTFIGLTGQPLYGSSGGFIMKAGETQAERLIEAFPSFGEEFAFSDMIGYNVPTSISADGKYILGYSYYSEDFYDDFAPAYFVTYVITTDKQTAIENVENESVSVPTAVEIYTVEGRPVREMTKGINIIRMSDGSVRKVLVK